MFAWARSVPLQAVAPGENAFMPELLQTVRALCVPGKGVLELDQPDVRMADYFKQSGVENNMENRMRIRDAVLSFPDLGQYVTGVILNDEGIREKGGMLLQKIGSQKEKIITGFSTITNMRPLPFSAEMYSEGLTNLDERCQQFYTAGVRFAKIEAMFRIGKEANRSMPSEAAIQDAVHFIAKSAAICQQSGIVPMVEPKIMRKGDFSLAKCHEVQCKILGELFRALIKYDVQLHACLLRTNFCLMGDDSQDRPDAQSVAQATLTCMQKAVPAAVGGIFFLSSGLSEQEAVDWLKAIYSPAMTGPKPWLLSFGFGSFFLQPVSQQWQGKDEDSQKVQDTMRDRLQRCQQAMSQQQQLRQTMRR